MGEKMITRQGQNTPSTIKDVAKMANASISTVSRVVNNKGGVSQELEDRIKEAIEKLKYKPNVVARALRVRTTKSLGLIVPSIENAIFPSLIRVIEDAAKKYGYSTILCNSNGNLDEEARYLKLLVEKQVDGIIFNAMGIYHEGFDVISETNTPIIILGKKIEGFEATNININNYRGAYLAVDHLIKTGASEVAFLFGQLESRSAISNRFEGYKAALSDNNITYKEDLVVIGGRSFEGGIEAADELLRRNVRFDAVFASNDMIALGCMDRLLESGYVIPDQVSVMGYDDIPVASIIRPHLSTVHAPIKEFGIEAVKTILRLVYTQNDKHSEKLFEPELVIRNSSKKLKL